MLDVATAKLGSGEIESLTAQQSYRLRFGLAER
jgi:hypothetical protein